MLTENQNPKSAQLDLQSTQDILTMINAEDRSVADIVADAISQMTALVDVIVQKMRQGGRLIYLGAGTSGRLGILDAVECVPTFGTSPEDVVGLLAGGNEAFVMAVEGAEDDRELAVADLKAINLNTNDVLVGIAASGRTPYVMGGIAYAQEIGVVTAGISCNADAILLDEADYPVAIPVGAEVLTGSTRMKAGTAQKLVLNMISTTTMIRLGKVYDNLMVDVVVTNDKLLDRATRIVQQIAGIDYDDARDYLEKANRRPKVAIVMSAKNISADEARQWLADNDDNLRDVLEG